MNLLYDIAFMIFPGVAIFLLGTSFIRFKSEKHNHLLADLSNVAVTLLLFASLVYWYNWASEFFQAYFGPVDYSGIAFSGPYRIVYLISPLAYGIFPQLFWVKRIRKMKSMRTIAGCLLLVAFFINQIVMLIAPIMDRDYIPSSWTLVEPYNVFYDILKRVLVFAILLVLVHLVNTKLSSIRSRSR